MRHKFSTRRLKSTNPQIKVENETNMNEWSDKRTTDSIIEQQLGIVCVCVCVRTSGDEVDEMSTRKKIYSCFDGSEWVEKRPYIFETTLNFEPFILITKIEN